MTSMPLWKRCRVLANMTRLNMLTLLERKNRLCVKAVAEHFNLTEDVSSKNLQLLAQAGLLQSERLGKFLYYSLAADDRLLRAVVGAVNSGEKLEDVIFLLTALTHERRQLIVATLKGDFVEIETLCRNVHISSMAMRRHLLKLERRGYVALDGANCRLQETSCGLGRELIEIAKEDFTLAQV